MRPTRGTEGEYKIGDHIAASSLDNYLVLPDHTMDERITAARKELGRDVVILGIIISAMK